MRNYLYNFTKLFHIPQSRRGKIKLFLSSISGSFMMPICLLATTAIFLAIGSALESIGTNKYGWWKYLGRVLKAIPRPVMAGLPLVFVISFIWTFTKGDPVAIFSGFISYLVFIGVQSVFIKEHSGKFFAIDDKYTYGLGDYWRYYIDKNLGVVSLNTSIFGSAAIALVVCVINNKWSDIQLPGVFSFFSGKRLVPLLCSLGSMLLSFVFLVMWPWIMYALVMAGNGIAKGGKVGYGWDSFLYGFTERALVPAGLHHLFSSLFWYTPLGGSANALVNANGKCEVLTDGINTALGSTSSTGVNCGSMARWQGDSFAGISALLSGETEVSSVWLFEDFSKNGLNIGRFTSGKYPIMQAGLPAAALAMYVRTPKEKRNMAKAALIPGVLSCSLLGITEPLEFLFLASAPLLFFGFHAVACGVSFMFLQIIGAHFPMIFSGGVIEFLFLAIIPGAKGTFAGPISLGLNDGHWTVILAVLFWLMTSVLYFSVFTLWMKKRGLNLPWLEDDATNVGEKQLHYLVPTQIRDIAYGLGGWDNVVKFTSCASRLRIDIKTKDVINVNHLKAKGKAIAVVFVGEQHIQVVFGPKAASINTQLLQWNGTDLDKLQE